MSTAVANGRPTFISSGISKYSPLGWHNVVFTCTVVPHFLARIKHLLAFLLCNSSLGCVATCWNSAVRSTYRFHQLLFAFRKQHDALNLSFRVFEYRELLGHDLEAKLKCYQYFWLFFIIVQCISLSPYSPRELLNTIHGPVIAYLGHKVASVSSLLESH